MRGFVLRGAAGAVHRKEEHSMSNDDLSLGKPITAHELRLHMAEKELEEARRALEKQKKLEAERQAFEDYFMRSDVTDEDRRKLRERVLRMAEQGHSELCVLTFPATFCADGGRAINNFEADWPTTLTGRAAKLYELWEANARDMGYRVEARVLNYPKGLIGDIGLYLLW